MIMVPANEPLTASILAIMYFGDVVFAVSGALTASLVTFFFIKSDITRRKGMIWADTLGLSVFGVVGCY